MPRLDDRLAAVANRIRSGVHADIGSDHGYLLQQLLLSRRIERGIAIENKQQPYANSLAALQGLNAEVRLADGLDGLQQGEADSLSLCGMGGELIAEILNASPTRVPSDVVIQPNRGAEAVRRWAINAGFHLVDEQFVICRSRYVVLQFTRMAPLADPAYDGVDREAAELFGPLLIKRWDPVFAEALIEEHGYLGGLKKRTEDSQTRFDAIGRLLKSKALA